MTDQQKFIERTYVSLTFFSTLAASLIWGINTLFLLDAGLTNFQAFSANAFFTLGQVLFEVPTGIVADSWGRRFSYLLGALTLMISTLIYVWLWTISASFWMWAASSVFIGLGFTFFSGATDAWLVDALTYSKHKGDLEPVFAKSQVAGGVSMLIGSVMGGVIAQYSNLGVPYVVRAVLLSITFSIAYFYMKDLGFIPTPPKQPLKEMKSIFKASIDYGFKVRPVRWMMLGTPFTAGVGIYVFYALQPYLLKLYNDPNAYSVAGFAAAGIASTQIIAGFLVPQLRKYIKRRTTILWGAIIIGSFTLLLLGTIFNFALAILFIAIWAITFAVSIPVNQALLNALIPSKQRATLISFYNLMGSGGGVVTQPALGRAADVYGYAVTYVMSSGITMVAAIFTFLLRAEKTRADFAEEKQ